MSHQKTPDFEKILSGLGPAGGHLMRAASELWQATQVVLQSARPSEAELAELREEIRAEVLESIAEAIRDELHAASSGDRARALQEILAGIQRQAAPADEVRGGWAEPADNSETGRVQVVVQD